VQTLQQYRLLWVRMGVFREREVSCENACGRWYRGLVVSTLVCSPRESMAASGMRGGDAGRHRSMKTWTIQVGICISRYGICAEEIVEGGLPTERKNVVKPISQRHDPGAKRENGREYVRVCGTDVGKKKGRRFCSKPGTGWAVHVPLTLVGGWCVERGLSRRNMWPWDSRE